MARKVSTSQPVRISRPHYERAKTVSGLDGRHLQFILDDALEIGLPLVEKAAEDAVAHRRALVERREA